MESQNQKSKPSQRERNTKSWTKKNCSSKASNGRKKKKMNVCIACSWLRRFIQVAFESTESLSMNCLVRLMLALSKEVSVNVPDCYNRPSRAEKLKAVVSQMLIQFRKCYLKIKSEHLHNVNNSAYLGLMSELAAVYVDLQIVSSKGEVVSLEKTAHAIILSLYVFLDESENHIAEALLKTKQINTSKNPLCIHILSTFLTNAKCIVNHESEYLRFLLCFKFWNKLQKDTREKRIINRMAVSKLNLPVSHIDKLRGVNWIFPNVSETKNVENITAVLINLKLDLIGCKAKFLQSYSLNKHDEYWNSRNASDIIPDACALSKPNKESNTSCKKSIYNSWDQNGNISNLKKDKSSSINVEDATQILSKSLPTEGRIMTLKKKENLNIGGMSMQCKNDSNQRPHKILPESKITKKTEKTLHKTNLGSTSVNKKFENIVGSFNIMKSNTLKRKTQISETQSSSSSKFDFSSKIVKITEEEFNGTQPKRARSWRSERKLQERKKMEVKLNSSNSNVSSVAESPKQNISSEQLSRDWISGSKTPQHCCCGSFKAFQELDQVFVNDFLKEIFDFTEMTDRFTPCGDAKKELKSEDHLQNLNLEELDAIFKTLDFKEIDFLVHGSDLSTNETKSDNGLIFETEIRENCVKTENTLNGSGGDVKRSEFVHILKGNVYSSNSCAKESSQGSFYKSWAGYCVHRKIITILKFYLKKRKEIMKLRQINYSKTKNEILHKSEECLKKEKKYEEDNKWLPLKKRGCSRLIASK